jgi:hypothetical protein
VFYDGDRVLGGGTIVAALSTGHRTDPGTES